MASIPASRNLAPMITPASPAPIMTTSTSSDTGSRLAYSVNGSFKYSANRSSSAKPSMSAPPSTIRLARACWYLAWTASGSKRGGSPRLGVSARDDTIVSFRRLGGDSPRDLQASSRREEPRDVDRLLRRRHVLAVELRDEHNVVRAALEQ